MSNRGLFGFQYHRRAAALLIEHLLATPSPDKLDEVRDRLAEFLSDADVPFSTEEKRALWTERWRERSPPDLTPRLSRALGKVGLREWAQQNHPRWLRLVGQPRLDQAIEEWLAEQPPDVVERLYIAAIRYRLGLAEDADEMLIQSTFGPFLSAKEITMKVQILEKLVGRLLTAYFFDTGNALPDSFNEEQTQQAFVAAVGSVLARYTLNIGDEVNDGIVAAIIGTLLQLGRTNTDSNGFEADVRQAWGKLFTSELGNRRPNNEIYDAAQAALRADRAAEPISFQEVAYVGDVLSTSTTRVDPDDRNFAGIVRVAAQRYLEERAPFGGLGDLPPLISEDSGDNEIEPDNVRAVAWVYAGLQYEQMRLFDVVDRITELFMNGLLPIGLDSGGQALDRYYWDSEDRLAATARYSNFTRVLGAPGGDVSREVQPNAEFNNLWLRFLSSLAEYDRQQRVADLFAQRRGLATTAEHVRKAGRDLAANASLYGWASTHFVARRLEKQIRDAIGILRLPSIQKAYAVNSPWQVIERVSAIEFGQAPNMVRHDTMARAGKTILDIVADNSRAWSNSRRSLFDEGSRQGDISEEHRQEMMTQTQYWLAVNGIKDDEIDRLSEPSLAPTAPSLPSSGGQTGGSANIDQLRQMVTAGQMPSMDQLQQFVGINGAGM